jgi:hypothetical protein
MRLTLAFMIVAWHTVIASYGIEGQRELAHGPDQAYLGSGCCPCSSPSAEFLVSGSLERSRTLFGFLGLRVIRLAPALTVESVIAMVVLGPIFNEFDAVPVFLPIGSSGVTPQT